MRARLRNTLWIVSLLSSSCSLTTAFDDFNFGHRDGGVSEGGGGDGTRGRNPGDGAAGGDRSDAGVPAAGSGGTDSAAVSCGNDSDCPDETAYACLARRCVPRRLPAPVWVSGGGGTTRSIKYVLRISSGAPQPSGVMKSKHFTVSVGAGAGRP